MRLCCSVMWCIGLLCVFALACGGGGDCDNPNPNYDASDASSQSCLDPVPTNGVAGGQVGDVDLYEGDAAGECSDDADNDQDGFFDCQDPGCADSEACASSG